MALNVKVVDLSADYRLKRETYEAHYCEHIDPDNLDHAVYGLPEMYRESIKTARLVANPGCYPTAAILGLLPFVNYINENYPIFIDAKSGVSGVHQVRTMLLLMKIFLRINHLNIVMNQRSMRNSTLKAKRVLILTLCRI